ncbi:MAG: DUF2971 domain-containing protein [Pyrinomonadaceae bacterium]
MKRERTLFDLESLRAFFENIKSVAPNFNFLGGGVNSLYHYTDLGGLKGIIESKDIWLTNSRYSNDDDEITYGYGIVKGVIEEKIKANPGEKDFLKQLSELIKEPPEDGIYTCSFCRKDNLLSQWRGYGANGTGVSIKFNPHLFDDVLGMDSPKGLIRMWQVFYDIKVQKRIIRRAIDFFGGKPVSPEDRLRQTADAIQFFIPTFKHAGFKEEKECRMIFTPPPDFDTKPSFRVARGMLIPYFPLQEIVKPIPFSLPITGIRIGPSMNKLLNKQSVTTLLNKNGYGRIAVKNADIPYRG